MALKLGAEYIERIRKMKFNAYYRGERIEDVIDHPATAGVIAEVGEFYDMTLDPQYQRVYPSTG